jgi:DNA-binding Lrp family transcriptional regulator
LTTQEKRIIGLLQEGLPLTERPFRDIAEGLGIGEDELLAQINSLLERGLIRRFGATLRQRAVGYTENAMVVWNVPDERADAVGELFARLPQVTHCYRRPRRANWPYNIFTMIHGDTRDYTRETAEKMALAADQTDYALLHSTKELKKSSMRYFK